MSKVRLEAFNFKPGFVFDEKYEVVKKLGGGWEGEVYLVKELKTGIERTAKLFLPQRNINNKAANFYAKKLHKLKNCNILVQYVTQETVEFNGLSVAVLISEYIDGVPLSKFLRDQKGKKLTPFQGVHLLHALSKGVEEIHHMRDYHGDIHPDNIIIKRSGLGFDVKLIDMFHWGCASPLNIKDDVSDLIKIFYDAIGGKKCYAAQPLFAKKIICGLKKGLIFKKYKTAGQLRVSLENLQWD